MAGKGLATANVEAAENDGQWLPLEIIRDASDDRHDANRRAGEDCPGAARSVRQRGHARLQSSQHGAADACQLIRRTSAGAMNCVLAADHFRSNPQAASASD